MNTKQNYKCDSSGLRQAKATVSNDVALAIESRFNDNYTVDRQRLFGNATNGNDLFHAAQRQERNKYETVKQASNIPGVYIEL
jgi:hypothetical protein